MEMQQKQLFYFSVHAMFLSVFSVCSRCLHCQACLHSNGSFSVNVLKGSSYHGVLLTSCIDGGNVFAWGSNRFGQLGVGKQSLKNVHPEQIKSLAQIELVACGSEHSTALKRNGWV